MGLMPSPVQDSGWGARTAWRCRICGAQIYSRELRLCHPSPGQDYMFGWRLLFRHGGEGGAVIEVQWDEGSEEFAFLDNPEVQNTPGVEWWITWLNQIHARDGERAEAAD